MSRTLLRHQGGELWSERSRLGGARFVIRLATQLSAHTNLWWAHVVARWPICACPECQDSSCRETLRERHKEVPVVVLTAHGDVATARAALKNGAFDFLEKPIDDAMLLDVLRSALRAHRERHAAATARAHTDRLIKRLAQREQEILEFRGAGQQNREIVTRLAVSARTVELQKPHIMETPAVES